MTGAVDHAPVWGELALPPGRFRYWHDSVTEPRHYSDDHLIACAADELLFHSRSGYFQDGVSWPGIGPQFWLVYRHITVDYLGEAFVGERLRCAVRARSRTRRSLLLEQTLRVVPDDRTVADARVVVVAFDTASRTAVEVPPALWSAIEAFEYGKAERSG